MSPKEYGPRLYLCTLLQLHYSPAYFQDRVCSYTSLRDRDMLIGVVPSNKRIKFIRAEKCVNWNFLWDIFQ